MCILAWFTDVKPTNIMMDSFKRDNGDLGWRNIQITDLEAAVVLPPKAKGLTDRLSGNPEHPIGHLLLCHRGEFFRGQKTSCTSTDWQVTYSGHICVDR
jgi:hypothetical protein